MKTARLVLALMACCVIGYSQTRSREKQPPHVPSERFTGITLGGTIEPGLFEIRTTGVSTAPVRTVVMQDEQDKGLALMRSLDATQQARARVRADKPGNFNLTEAYKDNVVLESAGILAAELGDAQRALLRALVREYVDNMDEGHARVKMAEVERHLDRTRFAWIPYRGPDAERQRLRQGPAAPAPRAAPARRSGQQRSRRAPSFKQRVRRRV